MVTVAYFTPKYGINISYEELHAEWISNLFCKITHFRVYFYFPPCVLYYSIAKYQVSSYNAKSIRANPVCVRLLFQVENNITKADGIIVLLF